MWTRRPWNICKSAFAAASTKKLQLQLSSNGFRVPMCLKEFGCHIISPCLAYGARTTFLACLASSHGSSFLFADDCCLLVSHILRIGNRCSLCPKKFFKFCSLNAGYAGVIVFFTCICVYIYTLLQQTLLLIFIYCCCMGFSSHRNLLLRVCIALLTEVRGEKLLSAKESPNDRHATKGHMLVDLKPFKTFQNYH